MRKNNNPIGVFDSGVGGISVLAELTEVLPKENFLYFGDSKNAPYGTKTVDEVLKLSEDCTKKLINMGAKAIVIACNTATSAAAEFLRSKYRDLPIIGIEPAVKPAAEFKEHSKILVMATPMTLKKEKFIALAEHFSENDTIIPLPCPGLVELIEQGKTRGDEIEEFLKKLLMPYFDEKIDSVVLGCTHYPFVKEAIKSAFPYEIEVFDGGLGTARQTKRRLAEVNLLTDSKVNGEVTFFSSIESIDEKELCRKLFAVYKASIKKEPDQLRKP